MLLVEQFAPLALGIGHRAYVMNVGRVVIEEPARELAEKPDLLRAAYLTGGGDRPGDAAQRQRQHHCGPGLNRQRA